MPISRYQSRIRSAVRGLWTGALDYFQFYDSMEVTIRDGFTEAWREGAAECDIQPSDYTAQERAALQQAIVHEREYIDGFATAIEQGSKANGGKLTPLFKRGELWINRYRGIQNQAKAMACGNRKMKWILGETHEHCRTCFGFNGRVYRASTWAENGALPQTHALECEGWRCLCRLEETTDRITPGRFPVSLLKR